MKKLVVVLLALVILISASGYFLIRSERGAASRRSDWDDQRKVVYRVRHEKGRQSIQCGIDIDYAIVATLDELIDHSNPVVVGTVTGTNGVLCDDLEFVCTESRVKIGRVLWGGVSPKMRGKYHITMPLQADAILPNILTAEPALDEIVVLQPGGELNLEGRRVIASTSDGPPLRVGKKYVLFLNYVPASPRYMFGSDGYEPYGGSQAIMEISDGKLRYAAWDTSHPIGRELRAKFDNRPEQLFEHFAQRSRQNLAAQ